MRNLVYIACSLDGFIARLDGSIDWLQNLSNPSNSDFGFNDFMESIDGILMGRNTFNVVQGFDKWPYNKPVFILSNKLREIDKKYFGKATIVHGNIKTIIEGLERSGIKKLYVDGGKTIQSFLNEDLIDEMTITTIPILLGNGIRLFDFIKVELSFEITKSEVLSKDMVKIHYKRRNRTIAST